MEQLNGGGEGSFYTVVFCPFHPFLLVAPSTYMRRRGRAYQGNMKSSSAGDVNLGARERRAASP